MSLSDWAARSIKPILFTVIVLCLMGIFAYRTFPVSILPDVSFPRVVVIASAGERPVQMVEAAITRPLEEALATVPNVHRIRSRTKRGSTEISIDFNWGADILVAEQLVNAKVNEVRPELPADARTETERMNPTIFPVLGLTLDSKGLSPTELYNLATYSVRPRLARVEGVARVVVQGGLAPEVLVEVDPARLRSARLSIVDVTQALTQSNLVAAVGRVDHQFQQFQVLVDGQAVDTEALSRIVVAQRNGAPIELRQIATVRNTAEDRLTVVSANGHESVLINIIRQPTANSVAMADAVKAEMLQLRSSLPPGVKLGIFYDQSILVNDAIQSVGEAVLIGAVLAVVVLLLFLRDLRATLVTAAIIPMTVLVTFLLMRASGLTLNLMTLGALAVGIGLVIDDAIVVVENVFRHLPSEPDLRSAVRAASGEIAKPMISSTLTTVVVFLPLALLEGVAGAFFAALAITLTLALLVSLVLALTVSPSLCAGFLRTTSNHGQTRLYGRVLNGYEKLLRWGVRHRWLVPVAGVGLLAATFFIAKLLGSGFMPEMDEGAFVLDYLTPPGTSLAESDRLLRKVDQILLNTPEVATFSRRTGTELGFAITEPNRGDYAVMLKPHRSRSIDQVIEEVRGQVESGVPGLEVEFIQVLQDLIGDLAGEPAPIDVKLFGENQQELERLGQDLAERLGNVKGLADLKSGVVEAGPDLSLRVDPAKAGRLGLTAQTVSEQAEAALLGTVATQMLRGDRQVPVRVRYPSAIRLDLDAVSNVPITTPGGATVPLGSLGVLEKRLGSTESAREDQRRVVDVTGRLDNVDLGTAIAGVRKVLADKPLPPGVSVVLGGQYQSQTQSFQNLAEVLALAILLVYAVMLFQFGSFRAPTVILLVMPLGLFGAVLALWATKTPLNVSSFMGAIMLVGIVVKNGILLLDRAQEAERAGMSTVEAVVDAGRQRLRPILMTSLTAILGLFPLALGLGAGAEMQKPLAVTVIGGLTFSTLVTLVLGPLLYATFAGKAKTSR
ncbi:efflux RND transporter permease subunit [Fimbriimonas ginsengisoli]|uniref:Cobalt-zinc-cadmium resistance protein CzcA n=1 Tax=Fimbriimonas ginsengisoli Gsoil 348 TaxID=661478 RepID=A0A068NX72_FIMGI|nr:efflux RND transporter permease subunit [Fimbriimonas ginsengisoli]AIE86224.1 Cobalt-zinc-cadmium resistance protein CzcA [Fimbriimonas ginsengisoli Gsoil 348]